MSGRGGRGGRGRGGRGGGGGGPQSISQQYLASTAREAGLDIRAISGRNGNDVIFPDMELHSGENNGRNGNATTAANSESNNGQNGNVASGAGGGAIRVKQESSSDIGSNGNNTSSEQQQQPCPRSPNTTKLISKSREMRHHFQNNSPFYIRSGNGSDAGIGTHNVVEMLLSNCLGGKRRIHGEGGGVFFPEELCGSGGRQHRQRQRQKLHHPQQRGGVGDDGKDDIDLAELLLDGPMRNDLDDNEEQQQQQQRLAREGGGGGDEDNEGGGDEQYEEDGEESDGADYAANYYESEGDDYGSGNSDGEPTY
ncbi:hypothetical protein ACHAXH_001646 [Discostella pseudostelligera]|jgi:hypothetical protein